MKSISTMKPAITENTECTIVKAHTPVKWMCHLNTVYHYTLFYFQLFDIWLTFEANNNARIAPACAALTKVWHQSYNARTANRYLSGKEKRNGVQRRIKVSFGRTIMQALELQLRLAKRHVSGRSNIEQ